MEEENFTSNIEKEDKFLEDFSIARNSLYIGQNFTFRRLQKDDFDRGLYECLSNLTKVDNVTKEEFEARFDIIDPLNSNTYKMIVWVNEGTNKIVSFGTIMFELKLTNDFGIWGHIEDVVVHKNFIGLQLGKHLIYILKEISKINLCYEIILNCKEELTKFYGKNQLGQRQIQMWWQNTGMLSKGLKSYTPPKKFSKL